MSLRCSCCIARKRIEGRENCLRPIVPVSSFGRAPEQGRIRYGIRAKGIPRSISKFRFTSSDITALEQLAEMYGGDVQPWDRGQSELVSLVSEIPIVLPPDPLSQSYELWAGATCVRRCDGVVAEVPVKTPDGAELQEVSCICSEAEDLKCKATTRLKVILPDIRFGGVWRMDAKGWYAAQELPAMVSTIEQLQASGFMRAFLALDQRQKPGKKFIVPMLRVDASVNQMVSGTRAIGYNPDAVKELEA